MTSPADMMRTHWSIVSVIVALWSSVACAQTPDRRDAAERQQPTVDLARGAMATLPADPLALRADSLLRAGRPWRATLLLASALRSPASASPAQRLVGARAAAAWGGWTEVQRLLGDAPWLDTQLEGEGRELLVRAALERGQPDLDASRRALASAHTDAQRVVRQVLLARGFDRANARDSAASAYSTAAARLPSVADWLRLRAAGVTSDSAARATLLARVTSPDARARVPWTDAQARERSGDFAGAARLYRSVSAEPAALRVESLGARDDSARAALAQHIVTYLSRAPQSADARVVLDVLDKSGATLARPQELIVARAASNAGLSARALTSFQRVIAGGALSPADQLAYAGTLARAGRAQDAIRAYEQLAASDASLGPQAAYQRARVLLQSGNGSAARTALRDITTRYANVRAADAPALLLLADLQVDDGDLAGAARSLDELATRHPDADQAPLARFRRGLITWNEDAPRAAAAFDSIATLYPRDDETNAARYWAARAYDRAGKHAEAESRWRAIASESPLTYYGVMSARRLRAQAWTPPAGSDSVTRVAAVDSAIARVRVLRTLGMDVEADFEIDALAARAERNPGDAAAIAQALGDVGEQARALRLALRAIDSAHVASRALYRSAYPVVHGDALLESSRRAGLDPALVAGLIRQESTWNPRAVSPAGARGLMQLMPAVGASIASSRGYPTWTPALLFDPDVSMDLGTAHLASSLHSGEPIARALAAYNAGASRVARWVQRPGASADPELFSEWIPYTETRDYVRVVQRNAEVYRALYGWR